MNTVFYLFGNNQIVKEKDREATKRPIHTQGYMVALLPSTSGKMGLLDYLINELQ